MPDSTFNAQKSPLQSKAILQELAEVESRVYKPLGLECSRFVIEPDSSEYYACCFNLNDFIVRFRVAKITPSKTGQFVTLWKRLNKGPIQPFDSNDAIDFFIINARKDDHSGQFIFPKSVLCQHDVLSINGHGGKRAIRVYPPWDITASKQAQNTQKWQQRYFLEIPQNGDVDLERANMLYHGVYTHQK
tara:strand:+ start:434 stop:1000 length:567 start_codon:yes stop_codon:yes gene_type:complete